MMMKGGVLDKGNQETLNNTNSTIKEPLSKLYSYIEGKAKALNIEAK